MNLNFKEELPFDAIFMEDKKSVEDLFFRASIILEQIITNKEKGLITQDKNIVTSGNPLIPYGDFALKDNKSGSHGFLRDQPDIARFALANPENLASVIIFVLLTIRADFQQVMHDFPVVMMKLHTKYANKNPTKEEWENELKKMEKNLAAKSNPAIHDPEGYTKGYGLTTSAFGFKNVGIPEVWGNRDEIFQKIKGYVGGIQKNGDPFDSDVVAMHKYLTQNITGLAPVKAAFVVQLIVGKLGCIDMHNVNLYSQYAKYMGGGKNKKKYEKLYGMLNPKEFSGKNEKDIQNYINVLKALEKEGANTVKLWDIWTNFVSYNYTNKKTGASTYDATSPFAGKTTDENDPLVQSFEKMSKDKEFKIIPDRSGGKDTEFRWGTSTAAGSASRSHNIIPNIRNKQWWIDILKSAENPVNPPSEVRFRRPSVVDKPAKALAYIVSEPELADELGLGKDYVNRAKEVLKQHRILPSSYVNMGQGKLSVPGLYQVDPDATDLEPEDRSAWNIKNKIQKEKKIEAMKKKAEQEAKAAEAERQQRKLF